MGIIFVKDRYNLKTKFNYSIDLKVNSNLKYTRAMWFTGQELHISTVDKDNLQLFHIMGYVASCCFPCPFRIQVISI